MTQESKCNHGDLVDTGKEEFEKLRKTLEEAKLQASKSKFTQSSLASVIIGAEETLNLVSYDLDTAVAEVTSAKAESKILSEYHDLVDKGKQQFKKELESIMPTVKLGKKGNSNFEHIPKTELQREYELEMRHQLMRQAAAHSDHINDVLRVQSKELEQQFDKKMEERVNDEREKYQVELHGALARLRGVESAIEDRADLEKQSENAQELWLACEALRRTVKYGEKGSDVLTPLDNEVAAIKEAGSSIPVVHGILEAIPEDALTRGVFTEESLIARWKHYKINCYEMPALQYDR
uniref:MICOS complex subunit MIC60 n=1 Tax=Saccoglossus kowalevskii TaxID=10224 RepID=A0ABM0M634_SACKO|nr:PREDICTED: mitochondrial inner membrane protein-like [Saccoglossus kowalevskii]